MKKGFLVLLFCMVLLLVVFVSYSEACGGGARANRGGLFRGRFQARESVTTTYRMSAPRAMIRMSGNCANGQCEVPMSQKK